LLVPGYHGYRLPVSGACIDLVGDYQVCPGSRDLVTGNWQLATGFHLPLRQIFSTKMVYLTRVEHFNAAHKLYNPNWSKEQNEEVFGKCANENWHGHNYELYVTVKGRPSVDTGFVFDVKELSQIINQYVIEQIDHKNLNVDVPFMQGQLCSTENLAIAIWQQLQPHLPAGVQLHGIKLYETPRIFVEYFGE
jgi:6-pyruvoyltetrahydropterin/6-carboxytetrahydropterin synthase